MSQEKNQRLKKCRKCFNYNPSKSKKCKFCASKFKISEKWSFVDKIKQVLRIDRGFAVSKTITPKENGSFFTEPEIDVLLNFNNMFILVFLTLDNINILNEKALLELGEMLTEMDNA